jgi:hypothetical protein
VALGLSHLSQQATAGSPGNERRMTDFTEHDRSADERDIRALERAYDEAWTAGDIERVMTVFTPDAEVVNPYGQVANGVAEIEPMLRSFLSGDASST